MNKNTANNYATREDVQEIVSAIVGNAVHELLTVIDDRFNKVEARLDRVEAEIQEIKIS